MNRNRIQILLPVIGMFNKSQVFMRVAEYIHEGFHGWDLMVVVGLLGSLAVF